MNISPKDFFLQVAVTFSLYAVIVSVITLMFQIINLAFPDVVENYYYYDPYSGPIRLAIATLIILFPVLLYLSRLLHKRIDSDANFQDSGFRKFLVYLTLFIAGAVILGDLIVVLNSFLGGEISIRFVLKALALIVIFGGTFFYYQNELRSTKKKNVERGMKAFATVLVVVSIALGFYYMGSPFEQRDRTLDQERVEDLQSIQWQIVNYWQSKGTLPTELVQIEDSISGFKVSTDPETGKSYSYTVKDVASFELCAEFTTQSAQSTTRSIAPKEFGIEQNWTHQIGKDCFERTIDPDIYPVRIN